MTPELERDFEAVREGLPEGYLGDAERFREALNRIRSELEAARESNDRLQGKWDEAGDRCPQCGTGVKALPYVKRLEQELQEAMKNGAEWHDDAVRYREALERIEPLEDSPIDREAVDVLIEACAIARRALSPTEEKK